VKKQLAARLGGYSGTGNGKINILDGIKQKLTNTKILYAEGAGIKPDDWVVVPSQYLHYNNDEGLHAAYFNNIQFKWRRCC
jgi:beta-glucosidase